MKLFAYLLGHLPQILSAIQGIEAAAHGTPGTTKKQIMLNVIKASAAAGEIVPEANVAGISKLIDLTVGSLNDSGVFRSKPQ